MRLPPRVQVPGQGRGLPVRGKALPLATLAGVLAALGASVWPQSMRTEAEVWVGRGGEGAPCGSGGPGTKAEEHARPVKWVKRALHLFKLSLKLCMF